MLEQLAKTTMTGLELRLRLLCETDIADVMNLEKSAHAYPWRQSSFEDCLKGRQKCWLAFSKDILCGLVVVTHAGGDAEILNISVSPSFQRRGIGRLLLQLAIEETQDKAEMLFLEVRRSNKKAIDLYTKEGFFEIGERKGYYPTVNGHEDAILMAYQLQIGAQLFS